ncbi:sulfatase [Salibacterium halotolerans]|uniref:Arylsulfatase A n=1 Tax=Salibacterium halotolerans TaxID=1884432 RepID=A0A1I5KZP8_9BACI|nr:sulfatase [Salibacterium halotolerans]SFO90373.1 Arylsulfatase A [Salibacterium halotolerans]
MKAIQLMFDTLKRDYLTPYEHTDVSTPNFKRLQQKTVQFDNFFAGSLPCMPARRDLHTGRYNFLHRGWGPLEPFDDSMPEILKSKGIYTHMVTDHKHYWRDGGSTYHPRYSSYELIRGQEGDRWKARVNKDTDVAGIEHLPDAFKARKAESMSQDFVNREYMEAELDHPMARTVQGGLDFLKENKDADQWFLQIECFDPHEPFFVPEKYLAMYGLSQDDFNGWLLYSNDDFTNEKAEVMKGYYKALVTMCDDYLGKILDVMDEQNMWQDTMLIVNTDHGLLLGEHDWWGKNIMPVYNEIAHLPFFIWNPQLQVHDETRDQLAQNIDVPATILEFFDLEVPEMMKGKPLRSVIESNDVIHESALFGNFGNNINVVDGDYIYMRTPYPGREDYLYEYTLMPMRMNSRFKPEELKGAELDHSFSFTKGAGALKIQTSDFMAESHQRFGNKLFHHAEDPGQKYPITDPEKEFEMIVKMKQLMEENEAPSSLYVYYGLDHIHSVEDVRQEQEELNREKEAVSEHIHFADYMVKEGYLTLIASIQDTRKKEQIQRDLQEISEQHKVTENHLRNWLQQEMDEKDRAFLTYQLNMALRID